MLPPTRSTALIGLSAAFAGQAAPWPGLSALQGTMHRFAARNPNCHITYTC